MIVDHFDINLIYSNYEKEYTNGWKYKISTYFLSEGTDGFN